MALRDPVAAYNADSNLEATLVCQMLEAAGIKAHAVEDLSQAAVWLFGLLPQVHRPQVYVDRDDLERAKPLLEDYVRRQKSSPPKCDSASTIDAICEECGKTSYYPISRLGHVETCSHCGAYVDVGHDGSADWRYADGDQESEDQPEQLT